MRALQRSYGRTMILLYVLRLALTVAAVVTGATQTAIARLCAALVTRPAHALTVRGFHAAK